jgi:hypothetical protein
VGYKCLLGCLWGSEHQYWGNHTPKGAARAALNELLPVDQRHRRAEARRIRAEQGGVKAQRTRDIWRTVRGENGAKHVQYQEVGEVDCGVERMYDATSDAELREEPAAPLSQTLRQLLHPNPYLTDISTCPRSAPVPRKTNACLHRVDHASLTPLATPIEPQPPDPGSPLAS